MSFLTKSLVLIQFILNIAFMGLIFIKPYILDDVFTDSGTKLNFKGIYDNPLIYFVVILGFILSFYLFMRLLIAFISKKNDVNTNINLKFEKKWIYYTIFTILFFVVLSMYHNTFVRYSNITPDYKAEVQTKMRVLK